MAFKPEEHFMKLKGNDYLPVVWRVVWLREEHADAQIETEVVFWDHDKQEIMVRAVVVLPQSGARATGHCVGTLAEFKFGYVEKAETQAIGRALALLGYGTAFAGQDLDEGERVADSPTATRNGGGGGAVAPVSTAPVTVKSATTAAPRAGGQAVTTPVPASQPQADPHAALRAEVVALLAEDGAALHLLQQQGKPLPPEQDAATLAKTKTWLLTRRTQARPAAEKLAAQLEVARSRDEVRLVLADARAAQERKEITEGAYKDLCAAGETHSAALEAGPLTARAQAQAQVAS